MECPDEVARVARVQLAQLQEALPRWATRTPSRRLRLGLPGAAEGVREALAVSPHLLSRVFRAITGQTISRHRARNPLARFTEGERDLARLAADTGFADQSHRCRVVRQETGRTPSALRNVLA